MSAYDSGHRIGHAIRVFCLALRRPQLPARRPVCIGDVVQLRDGGPVTVVDFDEAGNVTLAWYDSRGKAVEVTCGASFANQLSPRWSAYT